MDFPVKGNEMVTENEDGSYTIMINTRLSYDGQLNAYRHAMKHIENDDFQKNDVQHIEASAHAHKCTEKSTNLEIPAALYLERLQQLRKQKKQTKNKIVKDQKRVQFLQENYDMFEIAERQWLYGKDL